MDQSVVESLQALERTAAWVNQVAQMRQMSSFQEIKEDSMGDSNPDRDAYSDKDFDDIPDSYEGLQMNYEREAFGSSDSSRQADAGSSSTMDFVDIPATVQEFKAALESSGISQRFAAKFIMDSTSQGNLSFLLEKGKSKHWSELSCRGRLPYIRMRRWLDSPEEQRITLSQLSMTKEFKKTGPKDGSGRRGKFTLFQLMVLCRFFEEDQNPSLNTRMLLAEKLVVSLERITIWFQNQRARGFPAKRVLCLMSVDRQNAESEKAEFGRKYKNIQDDIQKRTQALTGALQNMSSPTPEQPAVNGVHSNTSNLSVLNGASTETQIASRPGTTDLSSVSGSIHSLPASLQQNKRFKPYDIPPVWGNTERYSDFTNYLLQQSSGSNGGIQTSVTLPDQTNTNMKRNNTDTAVFSTPGKNLPEKGMGQVDPRPTFLVQNMANSTSVFNKPYPHNAYQLGNIGGSNGLAEKEGMNLSQGFQIPMSAAPKMANIETPTSSTSYDKANNGHINSVTDNGVKLTGFGTAAIKTEPVEEGNNPMATPPMYNNPSLSNAQFSPPQDGHVTMEAVKTENVEAGLDGFKSSGIPASTSHPERFSELVQSNANSPSELIRGTQEVDTVCIKQEVDPLV